MFNVLLVVLLQIFYVKSQDYELILDQKDLSSLFTNPALENPNDPNANTYSIIDTFGASKRQNYLKSDNKYHFKLIYKYSGGILDILEWSQSSWLTDTTIIGADLYGVPQQNYPATDGRFFHGLGLTNQVQAYSYLDGNGDTTHWFNAVGMKGLWNNGIPAFNGKVAIGQSLYIFRPDPTECKDTFQCQGRTINSGSTQADSVHCQGNTACASATITTTGGSDIFCSGYIACHSAMLSAEDYVSCVGDRGCYFATIKDTNIVYANGDHAAWSATITAKTVYANGYYALYAATLDSADLSEMQVSSWGINAGIMAKFICRSGSTCTLRCNYNGCQQMNYICLPGSTCNISPDSCTSNSVVDGVYCPSMTSSLP